MKMNLTDNQKKAIYKVLAAIIALIGTFLGVTSLQSCNVTRTITTESSAYQKGDTSIIIQSKTIESYNAKKN